VRGQILEPLKSAHGRGARIESSSGMLGQEGQGGGGEKRCSFSGKTGGKGGCNNCLYHRLKKVDEGFKLERGGRALRI